MANDAAWQAGVDIATKNKDKNKDKKKDKKDGKGDQPASGGGGGNPYSILNYLPKLHKGTKRVKKTGPYIIKKGEAVLTSKQQKKAGLKTGSIKKRVASKG